MNNQDFIDKITARYEGVDMDALIAVMTPALIPVHSVDKTIVKLPGQSHYRASFEVMLQPEFEELVVRGRTGKFVPKSFVDGTGPWTEIAKGRFISIDKRSNIAHGEIYTGGSRAKLVKCLNNLSVDAYLEIDQYGAAAKVLSGLSEYYLSKLANDSGYLVKRMPEDMARHLGSYYHYDFEFTKNGVTKRVEAKSLWGTNTEYARLIHSLSKGYETSSCKFATQEIFAVSLFLRTGDIRDFAFARSIPIDVKPYGLPRSSKHRDYVHQNPVCTLGDGTWFSSIDEVWELD